MGFIRPAAATDICRLCEIEIFNYRLNFYPIFKNDAIYFRELQVSSVLMAINSLKPLFMMTVP